MKLGVVQGVEIYDDHSDSWDFGATIWFVQEHVRNAEKRKLKEMNCKVASYLAQAGFNIKNPSLFDSELARLMENTK